MATNLEDYKIHLHYLLSKEGIHVMDAKVHNECERHFLRALDAIKQYTGDFQIEVSVPNEGGYIDEFLIKIADSSLVDLIRDFVVAFITYYFTKKYQHTDRFMTQRQNSPFRRLNLQIRHPLFANYDLFPNFVTVNIDVYSVSICLSFSLKCHGSTNE